MLNDEKSKTKRKISIPLIVMMLMQLVVPTMSVYANGSNPIFLEGGGSSCIAVRESEMRHVIMELSESQEGIKYKQNGDDWDGVPKEALPNDPYGSLPDDSVPLSPGDQTDPGADASDDVLSKNMNVRGSETDWLTVEQLNEAFEEYGASDLEGTANLWFEYADRYDINVMVPLALSMQRTNWNNTKISVSPSNVGGVYWADWMSEWDLSRSATQHSGRFYPVVNDIDKGIELLFYTTDQISGQLSESPSYRDFINYYQDANEDSYVNAMEEVAIETLPPVEEVDEDEMRQNATDDLWDSINSFRTDFMNTARGSISRDDYTTVTEDEDGNEEEVFDEAGYNQAVNNRADQLMQENFDNRIDGVTEEYILAKEEENKEIARNLGRDALRNQGDDKHGGPGGGPNASVGDREPTQSPTYRSNRSRSRTTFDPNADLNGDGIPDGEQLWGYDDVGFVYQVFNRAHTNASHYIADELSDEYGITNPRLNYNYEGVTGREAKIKKMADQSIKVTVQLAEPGDIVLFGENNNVTPKLSDASFGHIGIYAGMDENEKHWMWHIEENGTVEKVQIQEDTDDYAKPLYARHKNMNTITGAVLPTSADIDSITLNSSSTKYSSPRLIKPNENLDRLIVGWTGPDAGAGSGMVSSQLTGTGALGDISEQQEADIEATYNVLHEEYGFSGEMIAGVIGNFLAEGSMDPTLIEFVGGAAYTIDDPAKQNAIANGYRAPDAYSHAVQNGGGVELLGLGIAQWSNGRNTRLVNYANDNHEGEWWHLDVQMEFMVSGDNPSDIAIMRELALRETGNPYQNALDFHDQWERSADTPAQAARRGRYAEDIWESFIEKGMTGQKDKSKIEQLSGTEGDGTSSSTQTTSGHSTVGCGDPVQMSMSGSFTPGESIAAGGTPTYADSTYDSYEALQAAYPDVNLVPELDWQSQAATSPFTGGLRGQCTELTWMYMNQLYGGAGISGAGNGGDVFQAYEANGADVTPNPTVGYGFSYRGILGSHPTYGHTGIVVGITDDNSYILANFNYSPYKSPQRHVVYTVISGSDGITFFGPPAGHGPEADPSDE